MKFKELRKTGKSLSNINIKVKNNKKEGGSFESIKDVPGEFDKYEVKKIEDGMSIVLKGPGKKKKKHHEDDEETIHTDTPDVESGIDKIQSNLNKLNGKKAKVSKENTDPVEEEKPVNKSFNKRTNSNNKGNRNQNNKPKKEVNSDTKEES